MKKILLLFAGLLAIGAIQAQTVIKPLSYTTIQSITVDTMYADHIISGTFAPSSPLLGVNGGTGVANTGKTITLGGNFTLSGAFALTLTQTGITNVTLPTTGTLATLSGVEAFANKSSYNKIKLTAPANSAEFAPSDYTKFILTGGDTVTLTTTANTNVTLPTTGTLSTLAGAEAFTNKISYNKIKLTAPTNSAEFAPSDYTKFILTGGDTVTLTTSANTDVTLPTTGTLSTLAGVEAFTNKTSYNKVKITAPATSAEIALSDASKLSITGGDTVTLATTANTSVTLPTAGKLMSESSADSVTGIKKFFGENIYWQAVTTITDTTSLSITAHQTVLADATSSAILITLPNAALCKGKVFEIKCINADAEVKVISAGGTIDATAGATGFTMAVWDSKRLISNGTNWYLL